MQDRRTLATTFNCQYHELVHASVEVFHDSRNAILSLTTCFYARTRVGCDPLSSDCSHGMEHKGPAGQCIGVVSILCRFPSHGTDMAPDFVHVVYVYDNICAWWGVYSQYAYPTIHTFFDSDSRSTWKVSVLVRIRRRSCEEKLYCHMSDKYCIEDSDCHPCHF